MAKKQQIVGPGVILDRSAKKGKLKIQFDPSPDGFVTEARKDKGKLKIEIIPSVSGIEPIEILAEAKVWAIQLENAAVPKDRLADLEALITEEEDVHVRVSYVPAPKLPGMEAEGGDAD